MQPNPNLCWNGQDGWPVLYPVQGWDWLQLSLGRRELPLTPHNVAAAPMGLLGSAPLKLVAQIRAARRFAGLPRSGARIRPKCLSFLQGAQSGIHVFPSIPYHFVLITVLWGWTESVLWPKVYPVSFELKVEPRFSQVPVQPTSVNQYFCTLCQILFSWKRIIIVPGTRMPTLFWYH